MLRWRLLLGTLIIAALVALCWLDHRATAMPGVWLLPVAVVAAVLATKEVLDLAALAGLRPLRWTVYCGNVLLVVSTWLAMLDQHWRNGWPLQSGSRSPMPGKSCCCLRRRGVLGRSWRNVALPEAGRQHGQSCRGRLRPRLRRPDALALPCSCGSSGASARWPPG